MNLIIAKLQIKLNELYNKVKNINLVKKKQENSTKNDLFIEFKTLHDDFSIVKQYIIEINESYINHKIECEKLPTQLEKMNEDINAINEKLANVPNLEEYNLAEIASQTNSLISSTESLMEEISSTQNGSDKSLAKIQRELDQLNIDMSSAQTNLSCLNAEISNANENLSSTQTQIDNINTKQTTQSEKQSNLTNKTSTLNSRLTTAEKNISAITGGIDVNELDSRITTLEDNLSKELPPVVCSNNYFMFLNATSTPLYSLYYYYKIDDLSPIAQRFVLNYTSNGTGKLSIKLLENGTEVKEEVVELNKYPSSYIINYIHTPTDNYQNFQFLISTTSTSPVCFNGLQAFVLGNNPQLFETERDLKVGCFDNEIYVTRYIDGKIMTGKFTNDTLSFEPKDLSIPVVPQRLATARCLNYSPEMAASSNIMKVTRHYYTTEDAEDSKIYIYLVSNEDGTVTPSVTKAHNRSSLYVPDTYLLGFACFIQDNAMYTGFVHNVGTAITKVRASASWGKWYFLTAIRDSNYINYTSKLNSREMASFLGYNEDGNLYFIYAFQALRVSKLGPGGKFATGYFQPDGSVHVYVNRNNNVTDKYKVVRGTYNNVTVTFLETIPDCDCYYEICNNKAIKHTSSGWVVV